MPDISPVKSSPCWLSGRLPLEVSYTVFRPKLATGSASSGRVVLMLMVAPMPPVGESARAVL